ncbi:MAG: tetratricopeptide repeat protein [Chloroflexi bacterium]|nr:tetratricopeptide repeat protein [Chloroflexota bacterium]
MTNELKLAIFIALASVTVVMVLYAIYGGGNTVSTAQQNTQTKVDPAISKRIQDLEKTTKTDPKDVRALTELGQLYLQINDGRKAQVAFQAGLELEPNSVDLHNGLGIAYCSVNKVGEAMAEYQKSMEIDPSSPEAYYYLGEALSHRQPPDIPKAIEYWEKVIKLAPDSEIARQSQADIDKNMNGLSQSSAAPALTPSS